MDARDDSTDRAGLPHGVLLVLGLLGLSLALYAGVLGGPAVWDDHYFVLAQNFLKDWRNLGTLFSWGFLTDPPPIPNTARPVWLASVLLDRLLFGDSFTALRLSNALWHAAGAGLLAAFAWEFTRSRSAAVAAGLLFVCHPVHTESVNIVNFRTDMLAHAFGVTALILTLRAGRTRSAAAALAGAAFLGLALLSKESGAGFLALAALTWALDPERPRADAPALRRAAAVAAVLALLFGAYLAFRGPRSGYRFQDAPDELTGAYDALRGRGSAATEGVKPWAEPPHWWDDLHADAGLRLRTVLAVHGRTFGRAFWPWPLQGDYGPALVRTWADPAPWAGLAAWLALGAGALLLARLSPLAALGLGWLGLAYLPMSGLVLIHNLEADRYLYIPSAGACLALASLFAARPSGASARAAAAVVLTVCANWSALTVRRNADYLSDLALYARAVELDASVPRSRMNLALALADHGRVKEAEPHFRAAIELWPGSRRPRTVYARFLREHGREDEAKAVEKP